MNILIKLMSIVSLVIAPYIASVAKETVTVEVRKEMKVIKEVDSLGNTKIDTIINKSDTLRR
jgi:K(+)-stimulated pyrophosphate-energized sodium pump